MCGYNVRHMTDSTWFPNAAVGISLDGVSVELVHSRHSLHNFSVQFICISVSGCCCVLQSEQTEFPSCTGHDFPRWWTLCWKTKTSTLPLDKVLGLEQSRDTRHVHCVVGRKDQRTKHLDYSFLLNCHNSVS